MAREQQFSVPDQLADELSRRPEAQHAFEELSYSHRCEYVQWIEEAGKPETRERRMDLIFRRETRGRP